MRYSWRRVEALLKSALASKYNVPARAIEVGKVVHLGEGLSRHAFGACACWPTGEESFVVLQAKHELERDQETLWKREFQLLERLSKLPLPFRVPVPVVMLQEEDGPIMVITWIRGLPLRTRDGFLGQPPWETLGSLAASVHALDSRAVQEVVPTLPSRRAHAQDRLRALEGIPKPDVADAQAWAQENLPPDDPPALLHGDLLGQNVLLNPLEPASPIGLIDWEEARVGDPAYDLAILTRGVRRPFQAEGGLERLLDSYRAAGGREVTAEHIRIHELCLAADWYRDALKHPTDGHPPQDYLAQLKRVLKMAGSGKVSAG